MSAFVIHAVSRVRSLEAAKKAVGIALYNGDRRYVRQLGGGEWEQAVGLYAAAHYSRSKPGPVSPKFDAPQFALSWAHLALRSGDIESFHLMALTPTGQINAKTKQPIVEWRRYAMAE
jgi:hypothetical protein